MISRIYGRSQHVAKLASAICFLSIGTANAGDVAPRLIKTTRPIRVKLPTNGMTVEPVRVKTAAIPDATDVVSPTVTAAQRPQLEPTPRVTQAPRLRLADPSVQTVSDLRYLLGPGLASGDSSTPAGKMNFGQSGPPRINQYVELRNDRVVNPAEYTVTPSATLGRRSTKQSSGVRINPLMDDALPKLRRFHVADRSSAAFASVEETTVVSEPKPLYAEEADESESTYEALQSGSTDSIDSRSVASHGGFGMLAIDQIGRHLGRDETNSSGQRELQRFANDLVLPESQRVAQDHSLSQDSTVDSGSLRSQLSSVDSQSLIASGVPLLPKPVQTVQRELGSDEVHVDDQSSGLANDVGLELESLLQRGFDDSKKHVTLDAKISARSRIEPPRSTVNLDEEESKTQKSLQTPPATRLSSPQKKAASKNAIPVSTRIRPGGLLNQWFGRNRY